MKTPTDPKDLALLEKLGAILRQRRHDLGLPAHVIGGRLGYSVESKSVYHLEKYGRGAQSFINLRRICAAYELDPLEVLKKAGFK